MKRRAVMFLVLSLSLFLGAGCATVGKDTQVKCPKCGALFTVDEGLEGVRIGLPKP